MERKIGEIFEYNGEWYQCIVGCHCPDCAFCNNNCEERERITLGNKLTKEETTGFCTPEFREDGKSVIFKKLEKVGEPYSIGTYIFQRYKVFIKPYIFNNPFFTVNTAIDDEFISIEIKQTDMEEKKVQHYDCFFDKKESNLKPFDLEAAKAGKPVCTRDGRDVRIICFDAIGYRQPIIALVTNFDGKEDIERYYLNGRFNDDANDISDYDLMMLPERKKGYVNLYHNCNDRYAAYIGNNVIYKDRAFAENAAKGCCNYIKTVKVEWEE